MPNKNEDFKAIKQELVEAGEDFSVYEGGNELWYCIPGDNCRSLILKPNGTWRLE